MSRNLLFSAALILSQFFNAAATQADEDKILNIGDAPPAMNVADWVKGDRVEKFEPGKTYVVDFGATWCGPCRTSSPHLTELAHKYKDRVRFVGVDIWEYDKSLIKPFLEEMGDKMDYSVATDIAPEKPENQFVGEMATTWMDAAEEQGIPRAFIIHDGKIAWIGRPMQMDEPLEKILAGDWDYGAKARERLAEKTEARGLRLALERVNKPFGDKDYKATLAIIDEIVKDDPKKATALAGKQFAALCLAGRVEEGVRVGRQVMDANWENGTALNFYFWDVIDPGLKEVSPQVAQLAEKAMKRAVELTKSEDPAILDTLAVAQFWANDIDKAIATEEKAIAVVKASEKPSESDIKLFGERIHWFRRQAVEKSKAN